MTIKLLINAVSGGGKTSLLDSMGEDSLVISRDGKTFNYPLPHMLVDTYVDMYTLIYGNEKIEYEGIVQKICNYEAHFGKLPTNIVIDSVSQLTMDVLDVASQKPDSWGSQGKEATAELALLTRFIHEELELSGMNVILMSHVTEEKLEGKPTGNYIPYGQGKFVQKGGFYSIVNESVTLIPRSGGNREVILRDNDKLARTIHKELPDKMWVQNINNPEKSKKLKEGEVYFNLQDHINYLTSKQSDVKKWSL